MFVVRACLARPEPNSEPNMLVGFHTFPNRCFQPFAIVSSLPLVTANLTRCFRLNTPQNNAQKWLTCSHLPYMYKLVRAGLVLVDIIEPNPKQNIPTVIRFVQPTHIRTCRLSQLTNSCSLNNNMLDRLWRL